MRIFTLEEANELIPRMTEIFDRIFILGIQARALQNDLQLLQEIWGNDVIHVRNPDNMIFNESMSKLEQFVHDLKYCLDEIEYLGGTVKDLDLGLVDFYCQDIKGRLVFLCWQYGEEKIKFYHSLESDFLERRPVKELMR